jgi:light-regulated signal transduction histidine kinase (bacteriophytochrome)
MSHEVRTPLNGIVRFTNLLLETPLNSAQEAYMRTIRSSGESLIQLTNDILDAARIETGKLKLELLTCDPRECIEDAFDIMATPASEKNLELLYWVEDSVPEFVLIDPGRLRQILLNLVGNAVKFTEIGEVMITPSGKLIEKTEEPLSEKWELQFVVKGYRHRHRPSQIWKTIPPFQPIGGYHHPSVQWGRPWPRDQQKSGSTHGRLHQCR